MNDNQKTKIKTKTTKAIIAAATILAVVASVAMIGIQKQMSQYALASIVRTLRIEIDGRCFIIIGACTTGA
jgi:hypothetical protein